MAVPLLPLLPVLVLVVLVVVVGFRPLSRWRLRHIPGPKPAWLFGNLAEVLSQGTHVVYTNWGKKYGPVSKFYTGGKVVVLVNDGVVAKPILNMWKQRPALTFANTFDPEDRKRYEEELFHIRDPKYHESMKGAWRPVFFSEMLNSYHAVYRWGAEKLLEKVEEAAKAGEEINIHSLLELMILDVATRAAFGVEINAQDGGNGASTDALALAKAADDIFKSVGRTTSPYVVFELLFPSPVTIPVLTFLARFYKDATMQEIRASRERMKNVVTPIAEKVLREASLSDTPGHAGEGFFLEHITKTQLKHQQRPLTASELISSGYLFMLAGFDTSSIHQSATVYLMALYPDKTAKLFKEISSPEGEKALQGGDLSGLKYLNAFLAESLRLFPPGAYVIRECPEDSHVGACVSRRGHKCM